MISGNPLVPEVLNITIFTVSIWDNKNGEKGQVWSGADGGRPLLLLTPPYMRSP
jgi:hypothetical protein